MKIAVGKSRKDKSWKTIEISREELRERLSNTHRTHETMTDYKAAKKDERDAIKDIGGFVGGALSNGRRRRDSVKSRSLVTLDADYAKAGIWDFVTMALDCEVYCYSTHSHTPTLPRLRFVVPLDREVTPEEYEPIARMIAQDIGINQFDVTTYEASRLMYWPSTSADGEFFYKEQLGSLLCADDVLARYTDWHDTLEWPIADREEKVRAKSAKAQGEPTEKPGNVGLFCRTYDVYSAIETFLPDIYLPCNEPNRYTYAPGSTSGGIVVYGNGSFSYSHHATDPAGGQLCNAFDLVRLHKFSNLDYEIAPEVPVHKTPSYKAMMEFVNKDAEVRKIKFEELLEDTDDLGDEDWVLKLEPNPNGKGYKHTIENVLLILHNDPELAGKIRMDLFENRGVVEGSLPWTIHTEDTGRFWSDYDQASLLRYLEKYKFLSVGGVIDPALTIVSNENGFHPVRDYLTSLEWDGKPRAEALFIDYLGAEDNSYTRAVTRKWLTAGVRRIMEPGCKFDQMLVLVGAQGIGKSFLARQLSKGWFTDTEIKLSGGKEPLEALRGKWIVEWAELTGLRKSEVESIKSYISSQVDSYRPAYARHVQDFKRQAIFIGSTNDGGFLRDATGNRRFWPIRVRADKTDPTKVFRELTDAMVDQIWAEAMEYHKKGETLYLDYSISKAAILIQEEFMEDNPWIGMVEGYLDLPLPEGWEDMDTSERRLFAQGHEFSIAVPTRLRTEFSLPDIDWEMNGKMPGDRKNHETKEMHAQLMRLKNWERTKRGRTKHFGIQYIYTRKNDGL